MNPATTPAIARVRIRHEAGWCPRMGDVGELIIDGGKSVTHPMVVRFPGLGGQTLSYRREEVEILDGNDTNDGEAR